MVLGKKNRDAARLALIAYEPGQKAFLRSLSPVNNNKMPRHQPDRGG